MSAEMENKFPENISFQGEKKEIARQEFAMKARILEVLRSGAKTVPEVAQVLGVTTYQANWWLMGCLRYGFVTASEKADEDGYYHYSLAGGK
jgi:hypothetical protein